MTQETGDMRDRGPAVGSGPPRQAVALAIGDGRDDWMLPEEVFLAAGCRLLRAESLSDAMARCDAVAPDLVFMPLTLDGKLTTDQLRGCLARQPAPIIVVLASNDQINTAAEAMRQGAHDCLFKPFSRSRLSRTIEEALKQLRRTPVPKPAGRPSRQVPERPRATPVPQRPPAERPGPAPARLDRLGLAARGFVASSPQMGAVLDKAAAVANSDAPVFISGEVATGKTALAEIIHELSHRAFRPFVTLTCATLTPEDVDARIAGPGGLLARATGGTLYLDEIADLSPEVQPRLLRLVERTTGAAQQGVRLVASTGHDPAIILRTGQIRPDLFYRLHVAPIHLPPLRARDGDPALIARVRLAEFSETEGRGFVGFSDSALALIADYPWPGNLRELINVIWTVVLLNQGPLVTPDLLPVELRTGLLGPGTRPANTEADRSSTPAALPVATTDPAGAIGPLLGQTLSEIERQVIEATIRAQGGSVPRAARVLDVSPSTLYRKREAWTQEGKNDPARRSE